MPYAIMRFKKQKGGAVASCERHNERKKEAYKSNPDIDVDRSWNNYHLIAPHNYTYKKEINRLIQDAECRTRSDSVVMVETLVTASPEFMNNLPAKEQRSFFERALQFFIERIGKQNIVSAVVHIDEKTPHMHLSFCPITKDGKLSAKTILGNQKALSDWQTDFHKCMSERYPELERGISSMVTHRTHIPTWLLKKGERLDKMFDEIRVALSDIGAFNAGRKRDAALELLSKWYPQADAFSAEVKKYSDKIHYLEGSVDIEKQNTAYWKGEAGELEDRVYKANRHIRELSAVNEKQERLLNRIPPEVLEQLKIKQKDKGAR